MTEHKFNKFMTCLVGNKKLIRFMEDLFDSGVFDVINPPVQVQLVDQDGDYSVRISDDTYIFIFYPSSIDDNMLQEMHRVYGKYKKKTKKTTKTTAFL